MNDNTDNYVRVPGELLLAAKRFAAKKDVRFYLNGVHIRWGDGEAIVQATNAHILFRATFSNGLMKGSGSVILPVAELPSRKTEYSGYVTIRSTGQYEAKVNANTVRTIQHPYLPDSSIEQVTPGVAVPHTSITLGVDELAAVAAAVKDLGDEAVRLNLADGSNKQPCLIRHDKDRYSYTMLIMSYTTGEALYQLPTT